MLKNYTYFYHFLYEEIKRIKLEHINVFEADEVSNLWHAASLRETSRASGLQRSTDVYICVRCRVSAANRASETDIVLSLLYSNAMCLSGLWFWHRPSHMEVLKR